MATQRTFTAAETQKKFEALPSEIKDLLYSSEMSSVIQKVGEKNKLHYDQMGRLEMEVTNLMLGFTTTQDFTPILMSGLEVDRPQADAVVQDLNDMLFGKIREAMQKVYEQHTADAPVVVSNPPAVDKSVVMPSASAETAVSIRKVESTLPSTTAPQSGVSVPLTASTAVTPSPATTPTPIVTAPKPVLVPEIKADVMLSETTVSMPPAQSPVSAVAAPDTTPQTSAPKPGPSYKTDPYREPAE